jgi:hypothetical protein
MKTNREFSAAALLLSACGLLWSQARADEPAAPPGYELVTVGAGGAMTYSERGLEHHPPPEWTSTKLTVKKGDMVLVRPAGVVSVNFAGDPRLQMVTPAGGQDQVGLLEMKFGEGDVIPVGLHGLGKWVSGYLDAAPESGTIRFRIRGALDKQYQLVGRYQVQVVVLPPLSP